jgi:hypothetical protein
MIVHVHGEEQNRGLWRQHGGCEEKSEFPLRHYHGREIGEREGYEVRGVRDGARHLRFSWHRL